MKYGINLTWNDLKQDEGALALMREYLPAMEIRAALQNRQQDIGYTEYYLTHKFKEETGLSVTNYTKFAKIERAKVLLKGTELSVREISEQLGFFSRNYFSRVFQEVTGKTPMEFREN